MDKKKIIIIEKLNIYTYIYFFINKFNTQFVYLCNSYQLESIKIKRNNKLLGVNLINFTEEISKRKRIM